MAQPSPREQGKQHAVKCTYKDGSGLCFLTATGHGSKSLGIYRGSRPYSISVNNASSCHSWNFLRLNSKTFKFLETESFGLK